MLSLFWPLAWRFGWVIGCAAICASQAPTAVYAQQALHSASGILPAAQLLDLNAQGQWIFEIGDERRTLDNAELVRWGAWSGILKNSAIWLSDGSWLAGRLQFNSPQDVTVHSDFFQTVKIPLRKVRGLVLVAPPSIHAWNRLQSQLETTSGGRDTIWLTGNRQIAGVLRFELDDSGATVRYALENAGQSIPVDSAEVQAIAFSPTLSGPLPNQAKQTALTLEDGSRLNIRRLAEEAARVRIELGDGVALQSLDSRPEFCQAIRSLTAQPPGTKFLADVEPASYKHIAQSQLTWPLGKNRDLLGRPLLTDAGILDRGLALHSSAQVAYRLDSSDKKFLAEVSLAIPSEGAAPRLGSAACQVMLARGGKLEQAAAFQLDRRQPGPRAIDVDLAGAQLLVLVTDQADFGQYGDHVLWLEARIAGGSQPAATQPPAALPTK